MPPAFSKNQFWGYYELIAMNIYNHIKHHHVEVISEKPKQTIRDLYIIIAQFHENVYSSWINRCINECCKFNKPVIVCGKAASVEYKYLLENTNAYGVIMGEPDYVIEDIIEAINNNNSDYPSGFAYYSDGKINSKVFDAHNKCLDDEPYPDYSFLGNRDKVTRINMIETSRECHGHCAFCEGLLYRKQNNSCQNKMKSPERVVNEIEYLLQRNNNRLFTFVDDNYFGDGKLGVKRAIEIGELLQRKKINIRYTIDSRSDDIDYYVIKELKCSGLLKVYLGFESGDNHVLQRYHKDITIEKNLEAIDSLKRNKILCQLGMIFFDPITTIEELMNTIRVLKPIMKDMYSYPDGNDTRKMFLPQNCDYYKFLANKRKWQITTNRYFIDPKIEKVYYMFEKMMNKPNIYSTELEKQIYSLEKAINIMV